MDIIFIGTGREFASSSILQQLTESGQPIKFQYEIYALDTVEKVHAMG